MLCSHFITFVRPLSQIDEDYLAKLGPVILVPDGRFGAEQFEMSERPRGQKKRRKEMRRRKRRKEIRLMKDGKIVTVRKRPKKKTRKSREDIGMHNNFLNNVFFEMTVLKIF